MLCDNPYIIPAFKTYCKLGFVVEDEAKPVLSMLSNYITMVRPINKNLISNFNIELQNLFKRCTFNEEDKMKILGNINVT